MLTWLLVNVGLGLLALLFVTLNKTAPHRLRFFATFLALAAWLVPWPLLAELAPNLWPDWIANRWQLARFERGLAASAMQLTGFYPVFVQTSAVPLGRDFMVLTPLQVLFATLGVTGGVLFAWNLVTHQLRLRRLARAGSDGNWLWQRAGVAAACPVTVQREITGAFSSGLWRPRIWVHGDLVDSAQLATLLRHELTHISQHDNWYLLVITLVEKLFWWNPLVWYLGRGTRELQELSCDERCQRSISDYPARLAQLMLDSARLGKQPQLLAFSANIFNTPNPNIKRLKLLQRSYPMLTRHILSVAITAVIAVFTVGFVTAQPDSPQAVPGQRVFILNRQIDADGNPLPPPDGVAVFTAADEAAPMNAPEGGVHTMMRFGSAGPEGASDQFMTVAGVDDDMKISFSFTDASLPMILSPLADMGRGPHLVPPGMLNGQATEVARAIAANDAAGAPTLGVFVARDAGTPQRDMMLPVAQNLVLEYPQAADRVLSVTGTDLTLEEALALVAEEAGCNIFQDGDKIVVDWCD